MIHRDGSRNFERRCIFFYTFFHKYGPLLNPQLFTVLIVIYPISVHDVTGYCSLMHLFFSLSEKGGVRLSEHPWYRQILGNLGCRQMQSTATTGKRHVSETIHYMQDHFREKVKGVDIYTRK